MDPIQRKQLLQEKLQKAVELELTTLPPYLTAWFSIKPHTNSDACDRLRSIFIQEMLHLGLAANILTAIGGSVKLGKDNIPSYPCNMHFKGSQFSVRGDRDLVVNLARFSEEAIDAFIQIELPEDPDKEVPVERGFEQIEISGYTIGQFYESIKIDLEELNTVLGPKELFNGDPQKQVVDEKMGLIAITDLASAQNAITIIVEEGEGAKESRDDDEQPDELGHYYRFLEIYYGHAYQESDKLNAPPTGTPLDIDYSQVYPIHSNCKSTDFNSSPGVKEANDSFNQKYTSMLKNLEAGFNGHPEAVDTAIGIMFDLPDSAKALMQLPFPGNPKENAAPSFEWNEDSPGTLGVK